MHIIHANFYSGHSSFGYGKQIVADNGNMHVSLEQLNELNGRLQHPEAQIVITEDADWISVLDPSKVCHLCLRQISP